MNNAIFLAFGLILSTTLTSEASVVADTGTCDVSEDAEALLGFNSCMYYYNSYAYCCWAAYDAPYSICQYYW